MTRRAKLPLNQSAIACADAKFYKLNEKDESLFCTDGSPIPLHPTSIEHRTYRGQWMDMYQSCGGAVELVDPSDVKPHEPVQPCCDKLMLVEVKELVTHGRTDEMRPPVTRNQYVNLDQQVEPDEVRPEYGRLICLKARVAWQSGKEEDLAGHKVNWYSIYTPAIRNPLEEKEHPGFDSPGSQKDQSETATDAEGWTSVAKFYMPTYGGEEVELHAELPTTGDDRWAGFYTVWRKFWYQVTEMARPDGGRFELPAKQRRQFEAAYANVFIEFEERGAPDADSKGSVYLRNIRTDERGSYGSKHFDPEHLSPFKAHILVVDATDAENKWTTKDFKETIATDVWQTPDFEWLYTLPLVNGDAKRPWLLLAEYRKAGRSLWLPIPKKKIKTLVDPFAIGKQKVFIDFSRGLPKPSHKNPVEIRLSLLLFDSIYGIAGPGQHAYIHRGDMDRGGTPHLGIADTLFHTAVHEVGHTLGMLNQAPADKGEHDGFVDKSKKGKGVHCSHGDCFMYWSIRSKSQQNFHFDPSTKEGCRDALLREDYSRSAMQSVWDQ